MTEYHIDLGPLQILRCGKVWAVDLWRWRLAGVGWRGWRFIKVKL